MWGSIFKALFAAIFEGVLAFLSDPANRADTVQEGHAPPKLKRRLENKIREYKEKNLDQ